MDFTKLSKIFVNPDGSPLPPLMYNVGFYALSDQVVQWSVIGQEALEKLQNNPKIFVFSATVLEKQ